MLWWILAFLCVFSNAYQLDYSDLASKPMALDVSETCTMITYHNETILHFRRQTLSLATNRTATVSVVNKDCDLVLFGYPTRNQVVLWYPQSMVEKVIEPNFNVQVARFGHALDVHDKTWVVGAPGRQNDVSGHNATGGYAFVYEDDQLHSCRSLYDTYCYPTDSTCLLGFDSMKDYYNLTDALIPPFQQECRTSGTPVYQTGPLVRDIVPYQQFGFDVVLTGALSDATAGLFISAPGDTNRFMEDNRGENTGRIYGYRSVQYKNITWWEMTATSPLKAPEIATVTYRAFGRSISASNDHLTVSTYPLYDHSDEPFVYIYDCHLHQCDLSPSRGISTNDLPGNVLDYLTVAEMSYTSGKNWDYIPADVPGDQLGDFQNEFIGAQVAIVGTNVLLPDVRHQKIYRLGVDSVQRETHSFASQMGYDTASSHWVHDASHTDKLSHLEACVSGRVGGAGVCQPCPIQFVQTDGWLAECTACPRNFTTNATGQTTCMPRKRGVIPGLEWSQAVVIMSVIAVSTLVLYALFVACECCESQERKVRQFVDTVSTV